MCQYFGWNVSLYRWEGAIQEDQETVLIAKTRHELMDELTETIKSNHSYECPCIIELPIDGGNPEFLQWIVSETSRIKESNGSKITELENKDATS